MTEHYTCTYCGDELARTDSAGAGETLECGNCPAIYDLVDEHDVHDLVVFECPYCDFPNKRSQSVESVVCENDEDLDVREYPDDLNVDVAGYDGDCGLQFDPIGADTRPVEDDETRAKMIPHGGDN